MMYSIQFIDIMCFCVLISDIAERGLGLVYTKRNILKISASFLFLWDWFVWLFCKLSCCFKNCVS